MKVWQPLACHGNNMQLQVCCRGTTHMVEGHALRAARGLVAGAFNMFLYSTFARCGAWAVLTSARDLPAVQVTTSVLSRSRARSWAAAGLQAIARHEHATAWQQLAAHSTYVHSLATDLVTPWWRSCEAPVF